jgi:hypothetical protein
MVYIKVIDLLRMATETSRTPFFPMLLILIFGVLSGMIFSTLLVQRLDEMKEEEKFETYRQQLITEVEANHQTLLDADLGQPEFFLDAPLEDDIYHAGVATGMILKFDSQLGARIDSTYDQVEQINQLTRWRQEYRALVDYFGLQKLEQEGEAQAVAEEQQLHYSELSKAFEAATAEKLLQSDVPDNLLSKIAQSDVPDNMLSLLSALKASN